MSGIETIMGYNLISSLIGMTFLLIIIAIVINLFSPRKSQEYRKLLTDMYVAGKIQKLAKEEDINLADEEKNFHLWNKKKRLEYLDLDRAIEEELRGKLAKEKVKKSKEK